MFVDLILIKGASTDFTGLLFSYFSWQIVSVEDSVAFALKVDMLPKERCGYHD